MGAFTETVAKFGAASNVATSDAATAFGRLENSFNADGAIPDFFNRVGSAIAKVGVESAASETEIIAVSNQISAAGSQFGFTADQIVGLSGALASVRIRPELARGAFQRILLNLSRAADEGSASFDKFAKYTNQTGQAAIDLFKQDPSAFFNQYITGIRGTIDAGNSVSSVLDDIGAKNVFDKQFILGLANGLDVYNKSLSDSAGAFKDGTFLTESTKVTFETFLATVQKLGNAISGLGARLGGGTLGPLTALADITLNVVSAFERLIAQAPLIGGLINVLLLIAGVTGAFLAFKAAQAFVLAGLVGLQQVMGKASIAGALSLKGNISELAKTMLMAKGASAQLATGLLANKTSMQQLGVATSATSASLARYATVSNAAAAGSGAVATRTAVAAAGMRSFAGSVLGLVGGPIGALVIGLASVITMLVSTQEESQRAGDAIGRAMKNGSDATIRAAAESLAAIKVTLADPIMVGNLDKTLVEVAKNAGVPFEKLAAAATKGRDAGKEVLKVMDEVARHKGFEDFQALKDGGIRSNNYGELEFLRKKVEEIGNASGKTSEGVKATDDAVTALTGSANAAAPSADGLAEGLDGVAGAAGEVDTKIGDAVDSIFGLVDAAAATQSSLGQLGASLQKSSSLSTGDAGGRDNLKNIQDVLRNAALEQQQLITSGQQTAEQASQNYTTFIDGLMQQLASKGVDVAQIQSLAEQAKGVFGTTLASGAQPTMGIKVDTSKVNEAKAYLDSIVAVYGTTNLDVILREGGSAQVQENVFTMQQYIERATGTPYTVNVDSDTYRANQGIHDTAEYGYSVFGVPFTAVVDANVDPATQALQFLAQYAATVVNGIIDGINTVNQAGSDLTGGLLASNQIGHVGWGAMPAAPAPSVRAVPNVPRPPAPPSNGPQIKQTNDLASSLDGLTNGYNDAGKAAGGAGDAGKQAGKDMADGIGEATKAAEDYANRLKAGFQSAFDKQYGLAKATDDYHSALNAMKKKRDDELAQLKALVVTQKELNNARKEDLITARKAGIEKAISIKYGEVDRAADYANQEQTALDAAAAKKIDIDANTKTSASLQAGIGNFKGYSDAAIANREALRNLEMKMTDMVVAYAATGKSQEQVRAYAQKLTAQFERDASQVWRNRVGIGGLVGDLGRYIGVVNSVPRTKPTTVTANTGQAMGAIGGVASALRGLQNKEVTVKAHFKGHLEKTGNFVANGQPTYRVIRADGTRTNETLFNKGGLVPGFAGGGLIPGQSPTNPGVDNLMASVDGKGMVKVRSGEFIVQQPAVDYWGLDFFKTLNNMKMPAFNAGGPVGGGRGGSGSGGPMLVELTAEAIAAIQRMPAINLYADSTKIAESANHGNTILASQGAN